MVLTSNLVHILYLCQKTFADISIFNYDVIKNKIGIFVKDLSFNFQNIETELKSLI